MHLPLLARVRRYRRCERCGLQTPRRERDCQHCAGLSEDAVDRLRAEHGERLADARGIGLWLAGAAALLAFALFVLL